MWQASCTCYNWRVRRVRVCPVKPSTQRSSRSLHTDRLISVNRGWSARRSRQHLSMCSQGFWVHAFFAYPNGPSDVLSHTQYEEQLRTADDEEPSHQQTRAQAVVLYYSSRMEAVSLRSLDAVMPHTHSYASGDHYANRHGGKVTMAWQILCCRRLQVRTTHPPNVPSIHRVTRTTTASVFVTPAGRA